MINIPKYEDLNSSNCREKSIKIHYPDFFEFLKKTYPDLSHSERLYWYYNNLKEHPVCKECGRKTMFTGIKTGYREYCSSKCVGINTDIKLRKERTNKEKYGTIHWMKNKELTSQKAARFKNKTGYENPFQVPYIKRKIKNTNLLKRGVEYPMQSKEIRDKASASILNKYNVLWNCQRAEALNSYSKDSKPNNILNNLLKQYNLTSTQEYPIEKYKYDFKMNNILIEVNPTATHNSTWGIRDNDPLPIDYHQKKTYTANKHGYRCINIWDWDDKNKIISSLQPKTRIYARKCSIKEVSIRECSEFLNTYHFQNTCNGQSIRIGLYYNDELVEIMTFGKPRYNKKCDYELLRLCTNNKYIVTGGSEKLFNFFVKEYHPKNIVSYCDCSKFSGEVYEKLGFKLKATSSPACHWYNIKTRQHITDNLLRQRGFDQLFNTNYGKGTSNEELMLKAGFVKVYDCGQKTYIMRNEYC